MYFFSGDFIDVRFIEGLCITDVDAILLSQFGDRVCCFHPCLSASHYKGAALPLVMLHKGNQIFGHFVGGRNGARKRGEHGTVGHG